tara:strand:- start:65 stop:442 length:378 start_codon:yes stop_codon:yes gene_type:complete
MASELRVNTLKDASGNNSIATSFVAGGSAKAWYKLNGSGTISGYDSFNIASFTDNGTGDYSGTFTSAMGNANYSASANTGSADVFGSVDGGNQATNLLRVTSYYHANAANLDRAQVYAIAAGDLA